MDKIKFLKTLKDSQRYQIARQLDLMKVRSGYKSGKMVHLLDEYGAVQIDVWGHEYRSLLDYEEDSITFNDHEVLKKKGVRQEGLVSYNIKLYEIMKEMFGMDYIKAHAEFLMETASQMDAEAEILRSLAYQLRIEAKKLQKQAKEMERQQNEQS